MAYPETRTQYIHKSLPYGTLADLKVWFADLEKSIPLDKTDEDVTIDFNSYDDCVEFNMSYERPETPEEKDIRIKSEEFSKNYQISQAKLVLAKYGLEIKETSE